MNVPQPTVADIEAALRASPSSNLTAERQQTIQDMNDRPVGRPFGHHLFEVDERYEDVLPTRGLSADHQWVCPALLYMVTGLDRSIFEMFSAASNRSLRIPTHRTPVPLLQPQGVPRPSQDPRAYTLQGIELSLWPAFRDYVATYLFRRQGEDSWRVSWEGGGILDPFWAGDPRWVDVQVMTVRSLKTGRRLTVKAPNPLQASSTFELSAVRDLSV